MKNKGLNKWIFRVIAALLLFYSFNVSAQSLTGTRGLIKTPTARMYESGTLAFGMGYVPAKFFYPTGGYNVVKGVRSGNAGLNTFITINLLPFMEVMFRYSHEFNVKVTEEPSLIVDALLVKVKDLLLPPVKIDLANANGIPNS